MLYAFVFDLAQILIVMRAKMIVRCLRTEELLARIQ